MMLEEGPSIVDFKQKTTDDWRFAAMSDISRLIESDYSNYFAIIHHWDGRQPETDEIPSLASILKAHKYDAPCLYYV